MCNAVLPFSGNPPPGNANPHPTPRPVSLSAALFLFALPVNVGRNAAFHTHFGLNNRRDPIPSFRRTFALPRHISHPTSFHISRICFGLAFLGDPLMSPCLSKSLAQKMAAVSYRLVAISRSYSSSSASLASQTVSVSHRPANSLAYFISRNTRGSLPVYTDTRNGGTRYLVLVRNIRGNIHVRVPFHFNTSPFVSHSMIFLPGSFSLRFALLLLVHYYVCLDYIGNGNNTIQSLRDDLASSLFPANSEQAARLKAEIARPDTLVVTGGRWKHDVMDWLRRKGF
ncbi:hypothetical protein A7U60_g8865 [Sanghuangporus baumii]|uniref:Large ribosomal subunit protein mL49 n=1 Tax=Sanghuangporus baumii TaxID=108892 RepID=A0A9Q5HQQ9_SANBA|nr:hypothetical protein A7U60_g8865 [Sanghuangporus baumii]